MGSDLEACLQRHKAFWRGEGELALVRTSEYRPLKDMSVIPLADGREAVEGDEIVPGAIDPARFLSGRAPLASVVAGDFLSGEGPPHLCWSEAVLGCPIRVATGGPWAEPFAESPEQLLQRKPDAEWLARLEAFVTALADRAGGRYPVTQPLLRGPIDMMASGLGHEAACLLLLEDPGAADAVLAHCAELFIDIARLRLRLTPIFHGGYLSSYGIWAPGQVVRTQLDNATMLSPKVYRERIMPHDRQVIESFEFPLMHVHSGCLHIADELLNIEALRCIQVSIDYPGGPLASEIMPILARILDDRLLIVTGPVSESELESLRKLEPQGRLCLQVQMLREQN